MPSGWDDSNPASDLEGAVPIKSTSARYFEYAKMRARANDKYDVAATFVSLAVVNHILSAIDAYWTVTRHNNALHAGVRMKMERTPFGPVPVMTADIRYEF